MKALINSIKNKIKNLEKENAIISLKGLPVSLFKNAVQEQFIEEDYFIDGSLSIEKLNTTEGKKKLVQQMITDTGSSSFISYEALIFAHRLTKEIGISRPIIILDFSFHPFAYPSLYEELPIIEDLNEEANATKDNISTSFYASVLKIANDIYVQFRDRELLNDSKTITIFESKTWEYETLNVVLEKDIQPNDLLFNFESRDYVDFLNQIIKGETQGTYSILIDNSIKSNTVAQNQLGIILNFLEEVGAVFNIKKVKYDLTKSGRPELQEVLKKIWGYDEFRSLKVYADPEISNEIIEISQASIIESIVEEFEKANNDKNFDDIFVTAPTGAGKSIMFQVPAIYLGEKHKSLSIVITPLKSLMEDQVYNLKKTGYNKVAFINSDISIIQRDEIYEEIKNYEIDLLYLAPELLLSYDISHFLQGRKLGLYVVDEAHTVTTWGRDFRVDYWYLGAHINKIRKYYKDAENKHIKFPVVAFTATAPYDGIHDVVFETLNSLKIVSAKKFIGYVKRENIEFDINHIEVVGNLQTQKTNITVNRIKSFIKDKKKVIIYCPYRSQVDQIYRECQRQDLQTFRFHSGLNNEERNNAQEFFAKCTDGILIATKAFGMGVDIKDIDTVYHFAPTGLLTDYVQEVGRAARDSKIQGKALVDYSKRDFQFVNVLHGLNRTHNWQLKEVMKRLMRFYNDNSRQNQLVSAEDFAYIFNDDETRLQNNVKSALMLLEKDLNKKSNNVPVLIARPKNLFATVYASIKNQDVSVIEKTISKSNYKIISYQNLDHMDRVILQLKLNLLWEEKFSDKSFGVIKKRFFDNELFEEFDLKPKLKIDLIINEKKDTVLQKLKDNFNLINSALNNLQGKFFTKNEFILQLRLLQVNLDTASRMADFVLPLFSQRSKSSAMLNINDVRKLSNFLQSRRDKNKNETVYRVIDGAITQLRSTIRRKVSSSFTTLNRVTRYLDNDGPQKHLYIKIGQLFEIFELGSYEVNGGENPKIFIRINDPFRLRIESSGNYDNEILQNIRDRHTSGVSLMKEFFESDYTSDERWEFIENYFLGKKQ